MNESHPELLTSPQVPVRLEEVVLTQQIALRPARTPDYKSEAAALVHLSELLAETPETILQNLSEIALKLCSAGSAGISVAETDEGKEIFRWRAVAGEMKPFISGTMPRDFSPCGVVCDTQSPQLMREIIRHYDYLGHLGVPLREVLLVPFFQKGKAIGTLWVIAHVPDKLFDSEDLRLLNSLSRFAAAAFRASVVDQVAQSSNRELEHSERQLIDTLESMSDALCAVDKNWIITRVNGHHERVTKKSRENQVGKNFLELWLSGPEFEDSVYSKSYKKAMEERVIVTFEDYYEPLKLWTEVRVYPKSDGGIAIFFTDITKRKATQIEYERSVESLLKSEASLRATIDSSAGGFYGVDQNGVTTVCNTAFLEMLGFESMDDAVGKKLHDVIHHTHPNGTHYPKEECPIYQAANAGKPGHIEEDFFYHLDGTAIPVEYWTTPIVRDGKVSGAVTTFIDITERKEARIRLQAERQKLEAMIGVSPVGIGLMQGHNLVFEMVNDQFKNLVGDRDYIGRAWQDVYAELPNSPLVPIMREVLTTGKPYSAYEMPIPIEVSSDNFEDRYYDFTYAQVKDGEGKPYGVYIQCSNVTERVVVRMQLEQNQITLEAATLEAEHLRGEAERANALKSAFLANMSHEIRTPLGAMMGFADLLKDPGVTATERQSFTNILTRNGESLSVIINDILDLSKVEAGHLTLEFTDTFPDQIGADVVSLLRVKANEKDLVLEYTHDETCPASVVADPIRVRQILLNLVSNAVKFTQFGSVVLRSFACKSERGRDALCFEVADTGIGIAKDQQENVFEMFVQADGSMTRRFGGTGLGLSLSRHLARAMGGDITITESEEGVGSKFLITIEDQPEKRNEISSKGSRISTTPQELPEKALDGVKILVVDDAPDNQQLIWRYLTKQGAQVESAENGYLGYRAAIAGNFDLVLMDIQMPVMDGYAATQKLREAGYRKPIIALTAHAMNEVRRKAFNVGYSDHLTKPINAKELIATIVKHVST